MIRPGVHLKFLDHLPAQPVAGDHTSDGPLDKPLWMFGPDVRRGKLLLAAAPSGEGSYHFACFLLPGQHDFLRVDHHDEVARVEVRREGWLVLAAQNVSRSRGHLAQHGTVGIDHVPLAWLLINSTVQLVYLW